MKPVIASQAIHPPDTSGLFLRLGIIGWPLEHSLSPHIHAAALNAAGLAGNYQLFPIPPLPRGKSGLRDLITLIREGELHGLNVTLPHKQTVLPWLDELTPVAGAVKAVNTIFRRGDRIIGDNTDVPGFLADLKRIAAHLFFQNSLSASQAESHALVLGAGGAARSVVHSLTQSGWQVYVAARRLLPAQELVDEIQSFARSRNGLSTFNAMAIPLESDAIRKLLSEITLIVNATPAGMFPQVNSSPWPACVPLPGNAVIYDLVYNPVETVLVRAARAAGLNASTGLGMLIEQAALSFERWTGQEASVSAMLQAALQALTTR